MSEQELVDIEAAEDEVDQDPKVEWLSFSLANLDYGVDILRVREIRRWEASTRIPYSPAYVVGLINLRGAIVPIIDMRLRLGLETKPYDAETVILILDIVTEESTRTMGVIVDRISDVIEIKESDIQGTAGFDLSIDKTFVAGITEADSAMVILLNVDTMLDLPL